MTKKSQRRPVRYEKDQSGCMWGFISMFDFRHARFTRKLIADRRSSKHAVDSVHSKNKFEMLSNLDEDFQGNLDSGESKRPALETDANKPSVKKLMEVEMFIDQDAMKDKGYSEVQSKESKLEHEDSSKVDSKKKKKSRKKSHDMDAHNLNSDEMLNSKLSHNQHSRRQSKDNIDLDKILEEFCHLRSACSVMHDHDGEVDVQSNQKHVIAANKARDAIHEVLNQMVFNGNELAEARKLLYSHEFMEALQLISSDKELFLRLLQDPNSVLLKYVQELGNAQCENEKEYKSVIGSNLSEPEPGRQTREVVNHKQRSFFRKKVKSQTKIPTNVYEEDTESSNRIVILKPGPMGLQNSESESNLASSIDSHGDVRYKGPSTRVGSHFSLTEIKKKLKHAMGKEKHGNHEGISKEGQKNMGQGSKFIGKDNVGMRSPNKDHFFIEKIARPMFDSKKGDKTVIFNDPEVIVEHENGNPKQRVSNINIEAKKHLSEMLGGDKNVDFSCRQSPISLGRILSLPQYNLSPLGSPGRDWENHFVTAQTRLSGTEKCSEANEDLLSPKQETVTGPLDQATKNPEQSSICDENSDDKVQEINSQLNFSDEFIHDEKAETSYDVRDDILHEVNVESIKETNALDSSSELVGLVEGKDQNCEIFEISDGARCSQCLNQDLLQENQQPSSPLSITKKIEDLESGADISVRPSPMSVLDAPFLQDGISSGSTRNQTGYFSVEVPVRPLQIQFEECDSSPMDQIDGGKHCVEGNGFIFHYIKAVLQASCLNRDQLWIKCLSSGQILDPTLFDQVEFFTDQPCHDQKLLYDCINEVLMEVCCHYFGVSPWVSFVKPSIRPIPNMKKVILKVWEGVCWHFLPLVPPHSLEQIVRKDMARSGAWMDLQLDAEIVGFEMGEAILEELMDDMILSCISESPESKIFSA